MPTYPGIAATYSDDAWARASLMTDGTITDGLLAGCEAAIAAERVAPVNHAFEVHRLREMVAHDEKQLMMSKGRARQSVRAGYARNLRWSRRALKAAEAAAADAELEAEAQS